MKFNDLKLGDFFTIQSKKSTGEVYIKCRLRHLEVEPRERMLAIGTWEVFPPTETDVILEQYIVSKELE